MIIDNIAQADQLPTTGFTPQGMPGFDAINPDSPWQPETADLEQAKQLMGEVANPMKDITLYINDSPGHHDIAVAIQAAWKELGIKSTIKQQELAAVPGVPGPAPEQADWTSTGSAGSATTSMRSTSSSCGPATRGTTTRTGATRTTTR